MLQLFRVRVRYLDEDAIVRAARTSTPVFVLNHRSNLDYVIAATSLADRAILSFAVGEWARYWPLEGLLRALGGFFVPTRIGQSALPGRPCRPRQDRDPGRSPAGVLHRGPLFR